MHRAFAAILPLVLTGSLLASPPATATDATDETGSNVSAATQTAAAGVPRYADARVKAGPMIPRHVAAITELDIFRRKDVSPRRKADYLVVQVVLAARKGRLIRGPLQRVNVDGPDRLTTGTRITVRANGVVRANLALTPKQRSALRRQARRGFNRRQRAGMIRVIFRHYRDASTASRIHEDVGSVGARARSGGRRLQLPEPSAELTSSSPGQVRLSNGTTNPLVLMAGPNSCMYDSIYGSTYSGDHNSQLGTMNGVILQPGQSIQAYVLNDKSDLDGKEDNQNGTVVLSDYNDYLNAAYAQASVQDPQDLPELIIPSGDDESPWLDMDLSLGFFGREVTENVIDEDGLWGTFARSAASTEQVTEAEIDAFAPFLETVATGVELFEEPVVEIVLELVTFFENSCMTQNGYMMIGATDQAHPWRQFAQAYDWDSASPTVPKPGSRGFASLANGIVGNLVTPNGSASPDTPTEASGPTTTNGVSTWTFTEADNPVDDPAVVSWSPGTRDVNCQPKDPATLVPPAGTTPAVFDTLPPYGALRDFAGDAAVAQGNAPKDYLVGLHYIAGAATASVHYSADGLSWKDIDVPQGQDTVTLPSNADAVLVKCDLQVAELFSRATTSGRTVLMGTRIASDIVTGPDYKGTPAPAPDPGDAGSYTMYAGPRNATSSLIPTEKGFWWGEIGGHVGFLDQKTGAVQWLPRGAAMVMTPDGDLWGTSRTSDDKQVLSRFDPKSYEITNYSVANGGGITRIVNGPNGCLWYLDQAGSLGTYCPNNGYNAEYPLQVLKYPESLYAGTDGNLWVSNAEQMVKFNTSGQAVGVFPLIWPQIQDWAQAPDGSAWTVANSDDAQYPMSLVRLAASSTTCLNFYKCGTTFPTPKLSNAFDGIFDSHGNLWYRAQNGGDNVIIRFNPTTQVSTQYEAPYRSAAPITVGTDGQIWSGGAYNDNRLLAVSTGSGPAEAPPSLGASVYVGVVATCSPATWAGTATVVRRYWTNAATGKVLAQGDTFTPGSDLQSQMIQCTEVATLPWVEAPLTATSSPAMVRRRYSTSGAMREQSPTKAFALPHGIAAKGTTTLVPTAVMTTAGQRATVTVTATHTGSAKRAQAKEWTLLRRNGAVKVRVHTKRALTLMVGVKAPRKGQFAPLEMTRVYRIEPGRKAARRVR